LSSNSSYINRIQTYQSKTLKQITKASYYVSNHTLHLDLSIPFVADVAKTHYQRFHNRLLNHRNPLLPNISSLTIPGNPPKRMLSSNSSYINRIQTYQSKTLKQITKASYYVSNHTLHLDLSIPFVADVAKTHYQRFHNRLLNHRNPLLPNISSLTIPGNPPKRMVHYLKFSAVIDK
ncbi:hypothetical protein AGLY_004114, partial [Aphis glycines]